MEDFRKFFRNRQLVRPLVGALLLVVGVVLLGTTERADRLRVMAEDALGGFVLTGGAAVPGPAADGQLVLAAGAPEVRRPALDPQFGVAVEAPALIRKVEMYQWNEIRFAGRLDYETDWFDRPIDASRFVRRAGHANPGRFPLASKRFNSPEVLVGGFRLASGVADLIDGPSAFKPDFSRLPPNMAATFHAIGDALVTSADAARPRVGDLRVSWQQIAPEAITVFARNEGGTLQPATDPAGRPIAQVMLGRLSLADVVPDAPQAPPLKWARRLLALLLAWAGVALLLRRAAGRDPILALAGALVPLAAVAAWCWFGVRTPLAVLLAVLAVAAAGATAFQWWNSSGRI